MQSTRIQQAPAEVTYRDLRVSILASAPDLTGYFASSQTTDNPTLCPIRPSPQHIVRPFHSHHN